MPSPTLVLVGFSSFLLQELDALLPERSVLILEEPDVVVRRRVASRAARHGCVAHVLEAPVQHLGHRPDGTDLPGVPSSIDSVAPGTEYGVSAAAALADRLQLPGLGTAAAPVFQDKQLLRRALAGVVNQPRWAPLDSPADAYAFARSSPGGFVVKPSRRQGSLGVTLCDSTDDLSAALGRLQTIDESLRSVHAHQDTFMIEEWLRGDEVSVEALVVDGVVHFVNVTDKQLFPGPHPVEAGHTVPSRQPTQVREQLAARMQEIVTVARARTTILHAEWIVDRTGTSWLVECAARVPGDNICSLISLAYGESFIGAYLRLLRGEAGETLAPTRVRGAAAIRFIGARPGLVTEVVGVEQARTLPGVVEAEVVIEPGQIVGSPENSYSRHGHVTVAGFNRALTAATADRARDLVKIATRQSAPVD